MVGLPDRISMKTRDSVSYLVGSGCRVHRATQNGETPFRNATNVVFVSFAKRVIPKTLDVVTPSKECLLHTWGMKSGNVPGRLMTLMLILLIPLFAFGQTRTEELNSERAVYQQ